MEELTAGEGKGSRRTDVTPFDELFNKITDNLNAELREVGMTLDQTQAEVSRLAQRSASLIAYVKQMQKEGKTVGLAEACGEALDAQQRYLILKAQVEKLQQVREMLTRQMEMLGELRNAAKQAPAQNGKKQTPLAMLEMLVQTQEEERRRLARQMHDGPAQTLSNFILQTEIAMRLFELNPDKAAEELRTLKASASKTFQQVREFIFELRPMMLDDLGLAPTLKRYFEALSEQLEAEVELRLLGTERRYPDYLEVFIFRTVQELVLSAIKQRNATKVKGTVTLGEREVKGRIEDNGEPIDEAALDSEEWMSLRLLRERIETLGGSMSILSNGEEGTIVSFELGVVSNPVSGQASVMDVR